MGFTLIELMLVVAIIGLLAAIAIPKFANLVTKAREASIRGRLGAFRSAVSLYYADNEGIYPDHNVAIYMTLVPKYIDSIPDMLDCSSKPHTGTASPINWVYYRGMGNWPPSTAFFSMIDNGSWGIISQVLGADPPVFREEIRISCTHTDTAGRTWSLF